MTLIRKSFDMFDETRAFLEGAGQIEIINTIHGPVGCAVFNPGWSWAKHVQPIASTDRCMVAYTGYVVSGRMTVMAGDDRVTYTPRGPADDHARTRRLDRGQRAVHRHRLGRRYGLRQARGHVMTTTGETFTQVGVVTSYGPREKWRGTRMERDQCGRCDQ
jgi:hypothetical protein